MQPTLSQFQVYSIGIVAQNKKLDEDIIYVLPIEITPFVNGELDASVSKENISGLDKDGNTYTVSVNESSSVKAKWLPLGETNRRTAPDVRRGERVLLYRHSDSDLLYWGSMGMDAHLRKLETVIWSWSGTRDENADSTDPENCYSLEVSTHNKLLTLRTSKADGEPYGYTLQLNTQYGNFVVTDDVGNYMQIDSPETKISLKNKDGTEVHLDKKDINAYAPRDINVTCDRDFNLSVGNNYNVTVGNNYNSKVMNKSYSEAGTEMVMKVGRSVTKLTPTNTSITADRIDVNEN